MKLSTRIAMAPVAAVLAVCSAGIASAEPTVAQFGAAQELNDGGVTIAYAIDEFEPSDDTVDFAVQGELWEADITVKAVQGTVIPVIPFFNARSADGQNYRVLYQVVGEESVRGATLSQGAEA